MQKCTMALDVVLGTHISTPVGAYTADVPASRFSASSFNFCIKRLNVATLNDDHVDQGRIG